MIIPQEILDNLSIDDISDIFDNFLVITKDKGEQEYMFKPEQTKEIIMELVARAYELGHMHS